MINKLKEIIACIDANYADIRYEIKITNKVSISNNEIRNAGTNSGDGFVLRVLKDGGFATVSFTRPEDAPEAIIKALDNAILSAENQTKPIKMAAVPVVKDSFKPEMIEDPRQISLAEKKELIKYYSDLLFAQPKIADASLTYEDVIREKYFVNSEGTEIFEELVTSKLSGQVISKEADNTQTVYLGFGGCDGFARFINLDKELIELAKIASQLLTAEEVQAGTYNVILDNEMTGVFTHEAFGHFSEADLIKGFPTVREKMQFGIKLGTDILNIVDDATFPDQQGFYKYDDEGVEVKRVDLMTNGVLTGRLHNRITAAEYNEPVGGHNIAEDYRYAPMIRMGSTFILPGKSTVEELFGQLGDGLYLCGMDGGVGGVMFTFGSNWGYKVKNGKIAGLVKGINMSGNLFETLNNITGIADDFILHGKGACLKGQANIRSTCGGPHILIKNITVGGV